MRLIDADELKKALTDATYNFKQIPIRVDHVQKIIDNAPSVFDCRSCKYNGNELECADCYGDHSNFIKYEERPHGEWIKGREISRTMIGDKVQCIDYKDYTCSNCGLVLDRLLYHVDGSPFYKFCPECGADMQKE